MESIISSTNVVKHLELLESKCKKTYRNQLLVGDLLGFESSLMADILCLYEVICEKMLQDSALELSELMEKKDERLVWLMCKNELLA
jgi:hypothetical protein